MALTSGEHFIPTLNSAVANVKAALRPCFYDPLRQRNSALATLKNGERECGLVSGGVLGS
jgi:hypothetical protein